MNIFCAGLDIEGSPFYPEVFDPCQVAMTQRTAELSEKRSHSKVHVKPIIHSLFQTRKLCDGRSAIDWQAGAAACQPIADRLPRDSAFTRCG